MILRRFCLAQPALKIEEVKTDIRDYFDLCVSNDGKTNKKGEHNFVFKEKFKGDCRKCGKYGHKASDCRSKGNAGKTKELTPKQIEK